MGKSGEITAPPLLLSMIIGPPPPPTKLPFLGCGAAPVVDENRSEPDEDMLLLPPFGVVVVDDTTPCCMTPLFGDCDEFVDDVVRFSCEKFIAMCWMLFVKDGGDPIFDLKEEIF